MLSDKVSLLFFFCGPGQRRRRERGWGVGGFLPEPRTLSEGNYILIPLRNLVCIRLPGTSANCLQCLSLCLLGVCMCVCVPGFLRAHRATQIHTLTDGTVEGCDSPRNTTHAGVITMQVDSSNYCVNSCILFLGLFFSHWQKKQQKKKYPKKKKTHCLLD